MSGEADEVSPNDFMLSIYNDLMENGWTLPQIDEMDIFYYFEILAYRKRTQRDKPKAPRGYIDQVL